MPLSPEVRQREVVATLGNSREFGRLLVARAWCLGLFQAAREGFVADGLNWNWSLFEQHFQPFGFVPIYRRWITWG